MDELKCPSCGSLDCGPFRCRFSLVEHWQVRRQISTSANEPGYWEDKAREDRQMYREEQARELERTRREP